jgi:hypothetical protein
MLLRDFLASAFLLMSCSAMMIASPVAQGETVPQTTGGIIGWISVEPGGGSGAKGQMLAIAGRALAQHPMQGRYSLEVKRHSKSGVSNSRQGGAITLKPGVAATLSQSAINIGPGDSLDIELKLYIGDREVFSASMKSLSDGVKL